MTRSTRLGRDQGPGRSAARSSSPRRRSKGQRSTRLDSPRRPVLSCGLAGELPLDLLERLLLAGREELLLGLSDR